MKATLKRCEVFTTDGKSIVIEKSEKGILFTGFSYKHPLTDEDASLLAHTLRVMLGQANPSSEKVTD